MADFSRLRERYGPKPKPRQLVNMAIRDDMPGGAEVLDAAAALHEAISDYDPPDCVRRAFALLQTARDKMSEVVLDPGDTQPPRG